MSTTALLDKQELAELLNADELELDLSFDNFSPNPSFVSEFVMQFVCTANNDPITFFNNWINKNTIIKDVPCRLNTSDFTLNGNAKLTSARNSFIYDQGQKTQYNILFEPFVNNFFEKSKSKNLNGFITNDDLVIVRYVTERNNPLEDIITLIVLTQSLITLAQTAYNTFDAIKEIISSGFDSVSAAIKSILKIAMNLIFLAAVLLAINELLKAMSEILFDKPKQMYALDVWSTLEKGCLELGYSFDSTLKEKYKDLTILLSSTTEGKVTGDPNNNTIPSYSLIELFERIGLAFNAVAKVTESSIIFEDKIFFENNPSDIQLSNLYNNGSNVFNFEELPETINIEYQQVPQDNNFKDNRYTVSYSPNFAEKKLFGVESKIDVKLPFALATRKDSQSSVEKIFNSIFDAFKGLNKSYKVKSGDRIGFLKVNQNIIPNDLLFIRDGEKISKDSNSILQSKSLFEEHYNNESPINKQFVTVTGRDRDPICTVSTSQLIKNNVIKDNEGRTIIVTKNVKSSRDGLYDIEYKRRLKPNDFGFFPESTIQTHITSVNNI
jgi:hypothetical protein